MACFCSTDCTHTSAERSPLCLNHSGWCLCNYTDSATAIACYNGGGGERARSPGVFILSALLRKYRAQPSRGIIMYRSGGIKIHYSIRTGIVDTSAIGFPCNISLLLDMHHSCQWKKEKIHACESRSKAAARIFRKEVLYVAAEARVSVATSTVM